MKNIIIPVLACVLFPCFTGTSYGEQAKAADRTEVSQYGITWTFEKPVRSGQFITGDWWVLGPVNVIKITPAPGKLSVSENNKIAKTRYGETILVENPDMRNGSMVADKCGYSEGYDSRILSYNAALSLKIPYNLRPSESLISTISNTAVPVDNFCKNIMVNTEKKCQNVLKAAAVLTCLAVQPPEDAFRPAYTGSEKSIYREKDLKWDLLPKLKTAGTVPSWEEFERYFQRPWIENMLEWTQQVLNANENQPNYGREHSRLVSLAGLMLCLDVPKEKKRKLALGLIQYGIDISGCAKNGGQWNWGGGHSSGRKWPVLFASLMLGEPKIYELPASAVFQEDAQTYYGKGWFGQTVLWQMVFHHVALTGYEERRPDEITDKWLKLSEGYRVCCTSSAWVGTALAARCMKAIKLWGHDAYFDYVDRWMQQDDPYKSARGKFPRPKQETKAGDDFVTAMWEANRKDAPAQELSGKNMLWIAKGGASKGNWVTNPKP